MLQVERTNALANVDYNLIVMHIPEIWASLEIVLVLKEPNLFVPKLVTYYIRDKTCYSANYKPYFKLQYIVIETLNS